MYAKALIPASNGVNVPLLIAMAAEDGIVIEQLHDRGWSSYAGSIVHDDGVELQIMLDRLALVVDGEPILTDETDPVSPAGWWEAVDALESRAMCVAVAWGTMDISAPDSGQQLVALMDSPQTAQALVTVVHTSS